MTVPVQSDGLLCAPVERFDACFEIGLEAAAVRVAESRGLQNGNVFACYLLWGVSEHVLHRRIGEFDPAIRVDENYRIGGGFPEHADFFFALPECFPRPQQFLVLLVRVQRLSYRRSEACHPVFEQEIGGAELDDAGGLFVADGSRHDDERNFLVRAVEQVQCAGAVELRQPVVRQNDVVLRSELRLVVLFSLDPDPVRVIARAPQFRHHQLGVGLGILEDEHAERDAHGLAPDDGGDEGARGLVDQGFAEIEFGCHCSPGLD